MLCHLLFAMPLLGLGLFYILPFWTALPVYGLSLGISALAFYLILRDKGIPAKNGPESLLGLEGVVVRGGRRARDEVPERALACKLSDSLGEGDEGEDRWSGGYEGHGRGGRRLGLWGLSTLDEKDSGPPIGIRRCHDK